MHVKFEFTLEDMIDTSRRFLDRSEAARRWRLKGLLLTTALALIVFYLAFRFILGSSGKALLCAALAAAVNAALYPYFHRRDTEKKLRDLHREQFGDAASHVCEVELTPVGVWVKQMNTQITFEWESVEKIEATADSVDILTQTGGVVVRDRAFATADERRKFIDAARGYLELARITERRQDKGLSGGA